MFSTFFIVLSFASLLHGIAGFQGSRSIDDELKYEIHYDVDDSVFPAVVKADVTVNGNTPHLTHLRPNMPVFFNSTEDWMKKASLTFIPGATEDSISKIQCDIASEVEKFPIHNKLTVVDWPEFKSEKAVYPDGLALFLSGVQNGTRCLVNFEGYEATTQELIFAGSLSEESKKFDLYSMLESLTVFDGSLKMVNAGGDRKRIIADYVMEAGGEWSGTTETIDFFFCV
eukprot:TRINITY_DN1354_c1_g1_i1.p1 TRINITY_DN1354_c1_g1~~TRINITY_DN1354_c1_g1_i1.p1  ORF type:complete len:228 (-),score=54.88 TRINITY_DN1354_c1_g1_i1:261-944(-)